MQQILGDKPVKQKNIDAFFNYGYSCHEMKIFPDVLGMKRKAREWVRAGWEARKMELAHRLKGY
jgi:hypothetical protein